MPEKQTIKATVWLRKDKYGHWFIFKASSAPNPFSGNTMCEDDKFVEIEFDVN